MTQVTVAHRGVREKTGLVDRLPLIALASVNSPANHCVDPNA